MGPVELGGQDGQPEEDDGPARTRIRDGGHPDGQHGEADDADADPVGEVHRGAGAQPLSLMRQTLGEAGHGSEITWQGEAVRLSDLAGRRLTYSEVGATASQMPDGYRHVAATKRIGTGRTRFEQASAAVLRYGMLRGAGVRVTASTPVARAGTDVLGHLGPFLAPCRVVYVLDEPNRCGFAYGSLPGHAVRGEELFAVRYDPADGGVYAEVAAFSRPATWWARLGSPVLRLAQTVVTRRYLDAV